MQQGFTNLLPITVFDFVNYLFSVCEPIYLRIPIELIWKIFLYLMQYALESKKMLAILFGIGKLKLSVEILDSKVNFFNHFQLKKHFKRDGFKIVTMTQ